MQVASIQLQQFLSHENIGVLFPKVTSMISCLMPLAFWTKAQETAKSAVEWCKSVGGNIPHNDLVGKLSHVGADGRYKANIERDCQMVITTFGKRFGAKISTAPVRMWNPKKSCIEKKNLPLIYPDDFWNSIGNTAGTTANGSGHTHPTTMPTIGTTWFPYRCMVMMCKHIETANVVQCQ